MRTHLPSFRRSPSSGSRCEPFRARPLRPALPLACLVAVVFAAAAPPAIATSTRLVGTSFAEAKETGKARIVVTYFGPAPAGDGSPPRGYETEMMNFFVHQVETEEEIDVEIEWRPTSTFREILDTVAAGEGGVFGINQISATEERRKRLAFSPPYMKAVAALVTGEEVPAFDTREKMAEVLRGRRAVTIPETTFAAFVEELRRGPLPDLEVDYVETAVGIPNAIRDDPDGTFAYMDYALYVQALKNGFSLRRHALFDRETAPLAVAMPLGSDWAPLLDRFFAPGSGFQSQLAWELLVRRYLGSEVLGILRP